MRQTPKIHALLQALAGSRAAIRLDTFTTHELNWAGRAGLAPLLLACAAPEAAADPALASLRAGDLTAKVMTGALLDAMTAILQQAGDRAGEITLLKGISVCSELYASPYQRAMGDIDLLIEPPAQAWLEQLLRDLGYRQQSHLPADFYASHSHSMPFQHPHQPVCVEVHTALFPPQLAVSATPLFQPAEVFQARLPGSFNGLAVQRLRPELQLAYIATHMAERLTFAREPSAFLDILLLLQKYGKSFDWDGLLHLLGKGLAANQTYTVLSYLQRDGFVAVPAGVLASLAAQRSSPNSTNLGLLHAIIDRYLLAPPEFSGLVTDWTLQLAWETLLQPQSPWLNLLAIPWNVVFVPRHPERFSAAFHWWRLKSWLGKYSTHD